MNVYKYDEKRNYDKPLGIEQFHKIINGTIIATGVGKYKELDIEGYDGDIRWVATKSLDGESWTLSYGKAKLPVEYLIFNCPKLQFTELAGKLVECTEEVLNLYSYD